MVCTIEVRTVDIKVVPQPLIDTLSEEGKPQKVIAVL